MIKGIGGKGACRSHYKNTSKTLLDIIISLSLDRLADHFVFSFRFHFSKNLSAKNTEIGINFDRSCKKAETDLLIQSKPIREEEKRV